MLKINMKLISKTGDLPDCKIIELQKGCVICKTIKGKELAFYYQDIYNFFEVV